VSKQDHNKTTADSATEESRLIAEGREKLSAIRAERNASPNDFRPDCFAAELHDRFADDDTETLEKVGEVFALAGRMLARRVMGKIAFVRVQDGSGRIQFVVQRDSLPEGVLAAVHALGCGRYHRRQWGDFAYAEG